MATGTGNIKDRLFYAYIEFQPIVKEDLPPNILEDYISIKYSITSRKSIGNEGSLKATLNKMTISEAKEIAINISLFRNKNLLNFEKEK